jgi:hypothetical protein
MKEKTKVVTIGVLKSFIKKLEAKLGKDKADNLEVKYFDMNDSNPVALKLVTVESWPDEPDAIVFCNYEQELLHDDMMDNLKSSTYEYDLNNATTYDVATGKVMLTIDQNNCVSDKSLDLTDLHRSK